MHSFHALGLMEKAAAAPVAPNPYAQAPAAQPSWLQKNVIDNPWLEGAAGLSSLIPVVGGGINGAWQGTRAAYHTAQGNYGKAGEAAAWGAAGLVPGGAVLRAGKLGLGGIKALRAGNTLAHGVQTANAAAKAAPVVRGARGFMQNAWGVMPDAALISGASAALPNAPTPSPVTPRNPNASMADQLAFRATQVPGYATM